MNEEDEKSCVDILLDKATKYDDYSKKLLEDYQYFEELWNVEIKISEIQKITNGLVHSNDLQILLETLHDYVGIRENLLSDINKIEI